MSSTGKTKDWHRGRLNPHCTNIAALAANRAPRRGQLPHGSVQRLAEILELHDEIAFGEPDPDGGAVLDLSTDQRAADAGLQLV